eukprot:5287296-Prymnesium_polylepis.1
MARRARGVSAGPPINTSPAVLDEAGAASVPRFQAANGKGMASEGLWGAGAGKLSEGCSRELCDAKTAYGGWTISMRFSSRRSSGLLTHC